MDPSRRVLSPGKERNGGRVVSPKGGGLRSGSVCSVAWRSSLRNHSTTGSGLPQTPESSSSDPVSSRVLSPGKERNGGRVVSPKGGGLRNASVAWSGSLRNRRTDIPGSPQRSAQSSPKRSGHCSRRSPSRNLPSAHDPPLLVDEVGRTLQSMEQAIAATSKAMKLARMDGTPGATERQAAVLGLRRELWAAFDSLPASVRSAVTPAQPTMFRTLTRSIGADRRVFIEQWASDVRQGATVVLPAASSLSFLHDSASAEALYYRACLAGTDSPEAVSSPGPHRQLSRLVSGISVDKTTRSNGAAGEWSRDPLQRGQLAAMAGVPHSSKSSWALATPRRGLLISPPARSRGSKSSRSCSEGTRRRRPGHTNHDGNVSLSSGSSESRNLSSIQQSQHNAPVSSVELIGHSRWHQIDAVVADTPERSWPRSMDLVDAYATAVASQPCVTEGAGEKTSPSLQDMKAMLDALLAAQKAGVSGTGTKHLPAAVTLHPKLEPTTEPEPEPEPVARVKLVALLGTEDTALGGNEEAVQCEASSSDGEDPVEFLISRRARPRRARTSV